MSNAGWDQETRRAFRAFVRTHHPDVGGDPEVFAAGVAAFHRSQARTCRHRDRYDAPVVVVSRPRGLLGLIERTRIWWNRRRATRVQ